MNFHDHGIHHNKLNLNNMLDLTEIFLKATLVYVLQATESPQSSAAIWGGQQEPTGYDCCGTDEIW